jgi:hypothetical protein
MQFANLNQMPGLSMQPPLQEVLRDTSLPVRFIELLPRNETDLYIWTAGLMAVYLAVSYAICRVRIGNWGQKNIVGNKVFDAATFAASILLLTGIVYPTVLTAIGSTKGYLLIAGFCGLLNSLHALFPEPTDL